MELQPRQEYMLKRKEKKIPAEKVASYVGCSQSMISRYETGNCVLSDWKLAKYQEYIDTHK